VKPRYLPKFPVWVDDILASLRWQAMSAEERGCYMQLLFLQWREGGLPDSPRTLLSLGGLPGNPEDHPLVIDAFPTCEDGFRRNPKCAAVRLETESWCDEQARKSRLGVEARRRPAGLPTGSPADNPRVNPRVTPPNSELRTQSKNPPNPPAGGKAALPPWEDSLSEHPSLDTPGVRTALADWVSYRREARLPVWKPVTWRSNLKAAEEWGPQGLIESIRTSIRVPWKGLFPPKANGHSAAAPDRGWTGYQDLSQEAAP
jgi:hypothetical protein